MNTLVFLVSLLCFVVCFYECGIIIVDFNQAYKAHNTYKFIHALNSLSWERCLLFILCLVGGFLAWYVFNIVPLV